MLHKKTKAFTLAEILITLGIIGVVAAMTEFCTATDGGRQKPDITPLTNAARYVLNASK